MQINPSNYIYQDKTNFEYKCNPFTTTFFLFKFWQLTVIFEKLLEKNIYLFMFLDVNIFLSKEKLYKCAL